MVRSPATLAVQASTIMLFHPLTLKVSHAMAVILLLNRIFYLPPSRHLSCITVLLSQPHLVVERGATLIHTAAAPQIESHDCMSEITISVLPRPDLMNENAETTMFI